MKKNIQYNIMKHFPVMTSAKGFLILVFLLIAIKGYAQQGDGLHNQVVVEKEAQFTIQPSDKDKYTPQIEEKEPMHLDLQFEVPGRLITVGYTPTQLKALGMKKDLPLNAQHSYIKVGMGSLLSPQVELAYNDIIKSKFTYGIRYQFLMAQGKLENQKMNYHKGGIYADYAAGKQFKFGFQFNYDRNVHHFYGYDHVAETFKAEQIRQVVNNFSGGVYFMNPEKNKWKLDYRQDAGFHFLFTKAKIQEYNIEGTTHLTKQILKKHFINLDFNFDINRLKLPGKSYLASDSLLKRNIFRAGIDYTFDDDNWSLKGGIGLAFDNKTIYILPNLVSEKRLYKHMLIFYSMWNRQLQKNDYLSIVSQNPYINDFIEIRNTRVENRIAGLKGTIQNFNYDVRFTNKVAKNMPLYVNDTLDMKRFRTIYDKSTQIINVQLDAAYTLDQKLRFDLNTGYTLYECDGQLHAWNLPSFTLNFRTSYNWRDKLYMYIDIHGIAGAYGLGRDGYAQKIKGAADINLGANYKFHKYFSVFCDVNNIAHMKYQNWYLYPTFGANATLGLKFSY